MIFVLVAVFHLLSGLIPPEPGFPQTTAYQVLIDENQVAFRPTTALTALHLPLQHILDITPTKPSGALGDD